MVKKTQTEETITDYENVGKTTSVADMFKKAMEQDIDDIAPNFRRKTTLSEEQINKIVQTISLNLGITEDRVIIGITLLFLQGAASAATPVSMSTDLGEGKCLEKRNIIDACNLVTGHKFIRRIAETLALNIGQFAHKNKLMGELGYRINNKYKADTGDSLNEKELAYCSSFSQTIPDLSVLVSERLSRLLAEDYQKRFENKKRINNDNKIQKSSRKKKK